MKTEKQTRKKYQKEGEYGPGIGRSHTKKQMEITQKYKQERFNLSDTLSARTYNLIIGMVVVSGFAVNALMAIYFKEQILALNPIFVLIAFFVGVIGCSIGVYKSNSPVISYIFFLLMSVCLGLLLVFYLTAYTQADIALAMIITGVITGGMMLAAVAYPGFFLSIGRGLFLALIFSVIVELIFRMLLGFQMNFMDYIVATIFSLYIGYDWARAQQYPKTADNAVDSAADIYVDIVVLFMRILSIVGRND